MISNRNFFIINEKLSINLPDLSKTEGTTTYSIGVINCFLIHFLSYFPRLLNQVISAVLYSIFVISVFTSRKHHTYTHRVSLYSVLYSIICAAGLKGIIITVHLFFFIKQRFYSLKSYNLHWATVCNFNMSQDNAYVNQPSETQHCHTYTYMN